MSHRLLAALLLATSGVVYGGVALPARRTTAQARGEYLRLWEARREARSRLAVLERREAARRRAAGVVSAAVAGKGDALALARGSALASLEGAAVSGVRLEVHPAKGPAAATLHFSAEGPSAEVIRLSGHIVRPGSGVVLDRVRLSPAQAGLLLELDGFSLGGRP